MAIPRELVFASCLAEKMVRQRIFTRLCLWRQQADGQETHPFFHYRSPRRGLPTWWRTELSVYRFPQHSPPNCQSLQTAIPRACNLLRNEIHSRGNAQRCTYNLATKSQRARRSIGCENQRIKRSLHLIKIAVWQCITRFYSIYK